jgi:hypothetical protein
MSFHQSNPNNLDFTSECLPGSVAEQKEKERLAEFHRRKAQQKMEEQQQEAERKAQRDQQYQADCLENQARMKRKSTVYPLRGR